MNRRISFKGVALTALLLSSSGWSDLAQSSTEALTAQNASQNTGSGQTKMQQPVSMKTIHGDMAGKAPAFLSEKGCGFFISGDLLCRKATLDDLDYVIGVTANIPSAPSSSTTYTMKERLYEPHFHWGWGFRVDAGYAFFPQDDWEMDAVWTYFYGRASQTTTGPSIFSMSPTNPVVLMPTWNQDVSGVHVSLAESHWTLHFNTFDAELGRNYFISKYFSARPLVALRGAWIEQDYRVDYFSNDPTTPTHPNTPSFMAAKNNYWGIGPRVGTDLFWQVISHWGFYGNASASLLYGRFMVRQTYLDIITGTSIFTHYHNNPWRVRPNIDLGLGTEIEYFLGENETYHLKMGVGYEVSYWFMQNMLARSGFQFSADVQEENADLAMQGWNFHVRFDF